MLLRHITSYSGITLLAFSTQPYQWVHFYVFRPFDAATVTLAFRVQASNLGAL